MNSQFSFPGAATRCQCCTTLAKLTATAGKVEYLESYEAMPTTVLNQTSVNHQNNSSLKSSKISMSIIFQHIFLHDLQCSGVANDLCIPRIIPSLQAGPKSVPPSRHAILMSAAREEIGALRQSLQQVLRQPARSGKF